MLRHINKEIEPKEEEIMTIAAIGVYGVNEGIKK